MTQENMQWRPAALDCGNDAMKALIGFEKVEFYIPNVTAVMEETRTVYQMERNITDGLHVEITSRSLKSGKGIYAVGSLAAKQPENDEPTGQDNKAESDQSMIMILTTLAVDAIRHFPEVNGVIEATYYLSTGLPLNETKAGKRKTFRDKLKDSHHEVRFLQTPSAEGKTVRIKFVDVIVNMEGFASMISLTLNENGTPKNEELTKKTVMLGDLGGQTFDTAVFYPDGNVDNDVSGGRKLGVSEYLDRIITEVEIQKNYKFKSRRELVETIINEESHIWIDGNRESIRELVDAEMEKLAKEVYKVIKNTWQKVPSIRVSYLIGGGAAILKDYLKEINKNDKQYPIQFVEAKESVWLIAKAYFILLLIYFQQKNIPAGQVEAAAIRE